MIWIPPGAIFEELFRFSHVLVKAIDPESALVSKAVKVPAKNKQLLRAAIASGEFCMNKKELLKKILKQAKQA